MIQLNVLPDVKLEYVKAQRTRRLIFSLSIIVACVAVAVLLLILALYGVQKHHLNDLNSSINKQVGELKAEPNINQILTVQNQLSSLNTLHSSKIDATNLYNDMNEITPTQVDLNSLTIDFNANTIVASGTANSLATVNQYVDTIKNTLYGSGSKSQNAFSDVVLTSFSINASSSQPGSNNQIGFTINYDFSPNIFAINQNVNLVVPSTTISRLNISQPSNLFTSPPSNSNNGGSQ